MSLGEFYKQVEKIILSDLIIYQYKTSKNNKLKMLNLYCSNMEHMNEKHIVINCSGNDRVVDKGDACYVHIFDMGINDEPIEFMKKVSNYREMLSKHKFNIINCRFSMRTFLSSMRDIIMFISFMVELLEDKGILMGFLLDVNKLNGIFAETPSLFAGQYGIEYVSPYDYLDDLSIKSILINGEKSNIIDFITLEKICKKCGLIHLDNVILESLYNNSLKQIELNENEKQFGFLNYVYLFMNVGFAK